MSDSGDGPYRVQVRVGAVVLDLRTKTPLALEPAERLARRVRRRLRVPGWSAAWGRWPAAYRRLWWECERWGDPRRAVVEVVRPSDAAGAVNGYETVLLLPAAMPAGRRS